MRSSTGDWDRRDFLRAAAMTPALLATLEQLRADVQGQRVDRVFDIGQACRDRQILDLAEPRVQRCNPVTMSLEQPNALIGVARGLGAGTQHGDVVIAVAHVFLHVTKKPGV